MAYDRSSAWGFGNTPGHMMERSARRQDAFARGRYGMESPAFSNMAPYKRKQRDVSMEDSAHAAMRPTSGRRVVLRGLKRMRVSGSPPTSPENDSSSGASSEDDIEMMDQINNSALSQAERAKALVLAQRRPTVIVKPQQQQATTTGPWPLAQFFAAGHTVSMGPMPDDASCRAMVVFDPRHSIAPSPSIEFLQSDDEARSSDDEAPFVRFEEIHDDEDMAMDVD